MVQEGVRVLLVDDDEDLREITALALRMEGFTVDTAANGVEALVRLYFETPPDALLLDLVMDAMHGGDVLEVVRLDPTLGGLPVVVMTGAPVPGRVAREASAVIVKPFGIDDLAGLLQTVIAGKHPAKAADAH
jgi:CheY-like chemotaxis protein